MLSLNQREILGGFAGSEPYEAFLALLEEQCRALEGELIKNSTVDGAELVRLKCQALGARKLQAGTLAKLKSLKAKQEV